MIVFENKDITTVEKGIIAHGVNCQGAMGSGVALALKNKWPMVYDQYKSLPTGKSMLGSCDFVDVEVGLVVANCYTQNLYGYGGGRYASVDAIKESMLRVYQLAMVDKCHVYLPKIGCARGGLSWENDVLPILTHWEIVFNDILTVVCEYIPEDETIELNQ